jgi:hypothetical protein
LIYPQRVNCEQCHQLIPDAEPIYRIRGEWGSYGQGVRGSVCAKCAEKRQSWHPPVPCVCCGRVVICDARRQLPVNKVCDEKCRAAVFNANAAARRWKASPRSSSDRMGKVADDWLPQPRILHPWPSIRFAVKHPKVGAGCGSSARPDLYAQTA